MENLIEKRQIMKETEKAVLVINSHCYDRGVTNTWLPKSQILIDGKYVIAVKNWLADKLCREHFETNIYSNEAKDRFMKYLDRYQK